MSHQLIFGMTESGKTTLAKRLAAEYKSKGIGVLVLDPLHDPDWQADFKTDSPEVFLNVFWKSRRCAAFIDEAGDCVGQYDDLMIRTATRGRHWGHSCHYISQRGALLARTVRDQCGGLFLFCTALDDCKLYAKEWNSEELLEGSKLSKGEFYRVTRFGLAQRGKLF